MPHKRTRKREHLKQNQTPTDLKGSIKKCKVIISMLSSESSEDEFSNSSSTLEAAFDNDELSKNLKPDVQVQVKHENIIIPKLKKEAIETYEADEHDNGLSSYEQTRMKNISENMAMLKKLELMKAVSKLTKEHVPKRKATTYRKVTHLNVKPLVAVRRSERKLNIAAKSISTVISETQEKMGLNGEENQERCLPSCLLLQDTIQVEDYPLEEKCQSWCSLNTKIPKKELPSKCSQQTLSTIESLRKRFNSLHLEENDVWKVLPKRITTVDIHPSENKLLVAAGDKQGMLAIWDVDSTDDNSICLLKGHNYNISDVKFMPYDRSKIFTSSYDGSMRCCDMNKLSFNEILSHTESSSYFRGIYCFSLPCQNVSSCLAAHHDGDVLIVDYRDSSQSKYETNEKPMKYIDCHPTEEHMFITCSNTIVSTWDSRNIKGNESALSSIQLAKSANSAPFSPITGNKIAIASPDDFVRVYDINQSGIISDVPSFKLYHNNFTGRWLTKFKCSWDPSGNGCFVIGSMAQPRQVDLYYGYEDGSLVTHLRSENLGSVSSVNVFHPTMNILIGANASGKMFAWR